MFCFYPDASTTREWLVRGVNYPTGSINYCLVTIIIGLISLYCQYWFSVSTFVVASDFVLIDVNDSFHFCSHHLIRT